MVRKSNPKRNADNLRILDRSDNISDTSTIFTSGETTGEKRLVDIAFDISTSCTGICVLDSKTGELVKLTHKKLTKWKDEYEKADNFLSDWIESDWQVRRVYIEEAAKKFTPGFSSADTIMTLGRFNGIISYMVYQLFGVKPIMVNVRSARAKLGIKIDYKDKSISTKDKVFLIVRTLNPDFPWIMHEAKTGKFKGQMVYDKVNEDMCDSWVLCRAGMLLNP
jgi:hypothetical protein